jgi:hypothetical protein
MTALTKYQRLECTGLWRDDPSDQRREVVVHLGDATLILSDPKNQTPISHWSLPAISRLSAGTSHAIYSPSEESHETLELDDPDMIAALDKVRSALTNALPRPGRLRGALVVGTTAALVGMGVFWVPQTLKSHTAQVLPPAKQAEIGQTALEDLVRITGAPCTRQDGLVALAALSERLFGPSNTPIVYVLRDGMTTAAHLPGDLILVSNALLVDAKGPDAFAGAILAEAERAAQADPMLAALDHAGLLSTFRLLTSGELPADAMTGYGQTILSQEPTFLPPARLLARFAGASVPVAPYALALLPDGAARSELIAADPVTGTSPPALMSDQEWLSLQSICES